MDPLFMLLSTINLIFTLGICILLFVQQRQIKALLQRPQVSQWNHQRTAKLSEGKGFIDYNGRLHPTGQPKDYSAYKGLPVRIVVFTDDGLMNGGISDGKT